MGSRAYTWHLSKNNKEKKYATLVRYNVSICSVLDIKTMSKLYIKQCCPTLFLEVYHSVRFLFNPNMT